MDVARVDEDLQVAYVVFAVPGTQDAETISREAHQFLVSRRPVLKGAGVIVESAVVPSATNWHGRIVPAGTWVGALRLSPVVLRNQRDLDAGNIDVTKRGDDEMDSIDRETAKQLFAAALQPVVERLNEISRRIDRVEQMGQVERDPFGAAVRRPDRTTVAEELAREKARAADPVGMAIREQRPPLAPRHPVLARLHRGRR